MTSTPRQPQRQFSRFAGPLAVAAVAATTLLAALAITTLATSERRVQAATDEQRAFDHAIRESEICATAIATQGAAWKSYVTARVFDDARAATRARSAFATCTRELAERLDQLDEAATAAGFPLEPVERVIKGAETSTEKLVEVLATLRVADATLLAEADREVSPILEQIQYELQTLPRAWTASAIASRERSAAQAAQSARTTKAWVEILSLLTIGLVVTIGVLAARRGLHHVDH